MTSTPSRSAWSAWAPAIVLSVLLAGAFHGALAGRLFYLRDVTQNHLPMRALVSARLAAGDLPLWNPYHGGGTPLLANPNHLVSHPITALFAVLPVEVAFTASIVLQVALLAWGAYLLARALSMGRAASVLGAAVMSLSGPAASLASMQNVLSAAAWVPLGIWALLRFLDDGRRIHQIVAVLALAVVLVTGEAASILAYAALAPALALTRTTYGSLGRAHQPLARILGTLLAIGGLAAALAAIQIVPAADLLRLSPRAHGLPMDEALKWSLEPARLLEAWLPRLFGDPTRLSPDAWWGRWLFEGGYPFLLSAYVGPAPLLLAAAAILGGGGRWRSAAALAGIAALFVLLALGAHTPLYPTLCALLPSFRQVRYPERFLIGAVIATSLLSALGLDHLIRLPQGARAWWWFGGAALVMFAVATFLVVEPTLVDTMLRRAFRLPAAILQSDSGPLVRGALLRSILWAFGEAAMLAVGAAILALSGRSAARAAKWGIAAFCGASMVLATAPARSTADPGWLRAPSPLSSFVGQGPAAPRLHHAPRPQDLGIWARTDEQIWGFRFDRFSYSLLTGHAEGVPTILDAATDRLDLAASAALGARLHGLPLGDRVRILRLVHAGLLLSYDELRHPDLVPGPVLEGLSRPPLRVYRVMGVLDRARFVPRARAPLDAEDLARSLTDPDFDPEREVLLDGPVPPAESTPAVPALVRVLQDDPERVRIAVEAPQSGYLVLADSFAPGWRALLDGAETPLRCANGLFRAVAVPAGSHEVEMTYAPKSFILGVVVSACGVVLTGLWVGRRRGSMTWQTT